MDSTTPTIIASILLVVLAGCTGAGPNLPTSPQNDAQTPISAYETHAFDYGGTDAAVINGGITYQRVGNVSRYYVTQVTSEKSTSRFNSSLLDDEASSFVAATDYTNESLIVVQAFPASSAPDYRVETLTRKDNTPAVQINDSSAGGTADITVETLLIRLPTGNQGPPDQVTITTEDGLTFNSSAGVVTEPPESADNSSQSFSLPYASDNQSKNVDEPRDVTIRDVANNTNGYHLVVTTTERPACRNERPACGEPSEDVTILERRGKLGANGTTTIQDVVSKRGTYRVTVEADVSTKNGSRTSIREEFEWELSAASGDFEVEITNSDVRFGYQS